MPAEAITDSFNHGRYRSGDAGGFYESFFQRANHPTRPLAFWIRYTLFSPRGRAQDAIGELWAIYFDGETGRHVAAKEELPLSACTFQRDGFAARIGNAELGPGQLRGAATSGGNSLQWDLSFAGDAPPLFLFPLRLYEAPLPRAKSLVGLPMATYDGSLTVNGQSVDIRAWCGSQNHNWGTRHTDWYAWGQVAGFDTHPDSFLEVATAQLRIGPLWTPRLTPLVLRHRGRELRLNRIAQTIRAQTTFRYFCWTFTCTAGPLSVTGRIEAPREAFVGLRYYNPPGGTKHCLNSKIASCELHVNDPSAANAPLEVLSSRHRAAFEILTDDLGHGIEIQV
jgi:hypothetical protein